MPPKTKITKEEIVNAAVDLVRKKGASALNARNIASLLGCSTQPIFSNFATMNDLHFSVLEKIDLICQDYTKKEMASNKYPSYKAYGMAYIRFAKEEKELFKLLYMRDRSQESFPEKTDQLALIESIICQNTGLTENEAKLFHLEMWAFVHGIATMFATEFFNIEWDLVSKMLTDAYQGLKKQYESEESHVHD